MGDITKKPFHETLVHAIMSADGNTIDVLSALVETTVIPAGHEAIVTAIEYKLPHLGLYGKDVLENMRKIVLDQKAEVEARKAEEAKRITDVDKLGYIALLTRIIDSHLFADNFSKVRGYAHLLKCFANGEFNFISKLDFEYATSLLEAELAEP